MLPASVGAAMEPRAFRKWPSVASVRSLSMISRDKDVVQIKRYQVSGVFLIVCVALAFAEKSLANKIQVGGVEFVPHTLEVGKGESQVISADLDNDGHYDLVVTNGSDNELVVFRGNERGRLARHASLPAGQNPDGLAAADIDGDGIVDLVVANHETSYLSLLIGDGRGGFRPAKNSPLTIDVSPHPHTVHAEDMDGDNQVDLIVDHRAGHGVLILKGLGKGAFEVPGTVVEVGGDPYRGMAVGDVNSDGRFDLITPNPADVGVLLSSGTSGMGFAAPTALKAAAPFAVELADFDGDGDLDVIAATDDGASHVEIFLGDGRGEFLATEKSTFRIAAGAKSIAVGDINGDGLQDAMVSSWNSDVLILLGGRAGFQTDRLHGVDTPWGLAIVDLNGDGKGDLVIADGVQSAATVYLSRVNRESQ